jgi:dipeptidyl aminopeptidase/acylaminoacyl peptidase
VNRRPATLILALGLALSAIPRAGGAQQPGTVAPGDNLVVDGIPAIPRALAEEVNRYTEGRGAGFVAWHPLRREILVATRFGSTTQAHRVAMPMGARQQLTFFDEGLSGASYDRTGRMLVLLKDMGGNEFTQLFRFDLADGRATLLTDGGRSQNGNVVWSHAGDRIAYGSTARTGRDRDIRVMDPRDPKTDRIVLEGQGGGWGLAGWSPDDRKLLVGEVESVHRSHLWLVDVETGERTPLTPRNDADSVSYADVRFAPDGRGVWLTTDRDSEFRRLAWLDLATMRITPVVNDIPWDVELVEVSPDGRTVAFVTNEAGASALYLLDARSRRYRRVTALPAAALIGGLRWRPDGGELGFAMRTATSTSDAWSLEVKSGRLTRWTESEQGGIVASELSEPSLIRWQSFDGLEITGFYYPPHRRFSGPRPVIISIHGGPEAQSRPAYQGRNNYYLNELGVALIYPNVRGSTGFGKTFTKLDNGFQREDAVRDIGALLDWIARQPELDASRVLVTGGSYGGYMTLASMVHFNDRIAAGVDIVGVSNFNTFFASTEPYRRDLRRVEYGDERDPAVRDFFERIAPVNNAHRITRPLFVIQGANDPRVPLGEAEQMVATVKRNGTPVWYLMARDEGHGFRKKENADFQFYATVLFVRRFLLGEAAASSSSGPARE